MQTSSLTFKGASLHAAIAQSSAPDPFLDEPTNIMSRPLWEARAAEFGVQAFPSAIVKRRTATWNGMKAEIVHVTRREKVEFRFRSRSHLLIVYQHGGRDGGETFVEGLPPSALRDVRNKLTFVPAGHEYRESHEPRVLARMIFIHIEANSLPIGTESGGPRKLSPRLYFENVALRETALKLAASVEGGLEDDVSYLDALGAVLVHELLRLDHGVSAKPMARGGLAGWQQRVVTSYIEEHVDQTIPLAKLAELARLSPYYFCRAFKESFGLPPHRYHISRRIDRAKALLANASQSVTEIGLSLGFSETSSFTATFRKMTGSTPTGYRRSLA